MMGTLDARHYVFSPVIFVQSYAYLCNHMSFYDHALSSTPRVLHLWAHLRGWLSKSQLFPSLIHIQVSCKEVAYAERVRL